MALAGKIIKIAGANRLTDDPIDVGLEFAGRADRHGGNATGPRRTSVQNAGLIRLTIDCQPVASDRQRAVSRNTRDLSIVMRLAASFGLNGLCQVKHVVVLFSLPKNFLQ